jgi:hypothetical protein
VKAKKIGLGFLTIGLILISGCSTSDSDTDPRLNPDLVYEGWWQQYDGLSHFGHDNDIHESENFVIYSDACDLAEKKRMADMLEDLLLEHMGRLTIKSKDEFIYTTPDQKLHCYFSKYLAFPWGAGFYSTSGFMLVSSDSPQVNWPDGSYPRVLMHELLHVIGALLAEGVKGDAWFIEGIAEYVSEISGLKPLIETASELEAWMSQQQDDGYGGNPIAIHTYEDVRISDPHATGNYDPFFELAIRYLLDPRGYGRTWLDVKKVFLDLRQNLSFARAFQNHFKMSLAYYEANFFNLLLAYLPD